MFPGNQPSASDYLLMMMTSQYSNTLAAVYAAENSYMLINYEFLQIEHV